MTVSLQELFDAGVHLGHQAQKWHPRMKAWIYGEQDGIHIFDLEKTAVQLEKARVRIKDLKSAGKSVVVVATKKAAAEIVMNLAEKMGVMYVVNRWPGGLITNWEQVRKSIKRMNEIENGLAGDKYKDYTKYERMILEKELERLRRLFGGIKDLKAKPDALLVVDAMKEKNAVREALKEGVEVMALIDSNTDPTGIFLPIPGNDDALSSIKLIVTEVLEGKGAQKENEVVELEEAGKEKVELVEKGGEVKPTVKEEVRVGEKQVEEEKTEPKEGEPAIEATKIAELVKKDEAVTVKEGVKVKVKVVTSMVPQGETKEVKTAKKVKTAGAESVGETEKKVVKKVVKVKKAVKEVK